jgi:diaminohydroxyphosphoribosylaminopyrimidine deaminase/5-amino-6-(5-phosphoribosylamino)uracil reductase
MERALERARDGEHRTRPNPLVGAVLASATGDVLAEAAHLELGGAHAERACLALLGGRVAPEDATLYVTLEPCSHQGRTPPCTDAILEAQVRRVVIGCSDPNPVTAGVGPRLLRAAGVEVSFIGGALERAALQLTSGLQSLHRRGRPFVVAKWAMTRDGALATGWPEQRWITSEASRARVHELRASVGAVVTGIGSVLEDDPRMDVRGSAARMLLSQPARIVLDGAARIPLASALVRTASDAAPVVVIVSDDASLERVAALDQQAGVSVVQSPAQTRLDAMLAWCVERGIADVMIESGPTLLRACWDAGIVDRSLVFVAPDAAGPTAVPRLHPGEPMVTAALAPDAREPSGRDEVYDVIHQHPSSWRTS